MWNRETAEFRGASHPSPVCSIICALYSVLLFHIEDKINVCSSEGHFSLPIHTDQSIFLFSNGVRLRQILYLLSLRTLGQYLSLCGG